MKKSFLSTIRRARDYRYHKSVEYPTDIRNLESATALEYLYYYLEVLQENHPGFVVSLNMDREEYLDFFHHLTRYGFSLRIEDPEKFISDKFKRGLCQHGQN